MLDALEPVASLGHLDTARAAVATVHISDAIAGYVVQLLQATRDHPSIRVGASTRGGVAVVALARAFAAMAGRTFITPDDVVRAAQDWETFSSTGGNLVDEIPGRTNATLGTTDPPRHDRLRARAGKRPPDPARTRTSVALQAQISLCRRRCTTA